MNYSSDNNISLLTQESLSSRVLAGYRSFFYLWSPSETSFAKVEDVPSYVNEVDNKQIINYTINYITKKFCVILCERLLSGNLRMLLNKL